ncbi:MULTISPECIES: hypothetical protein [Pseudomonas]|uniref:Uncharacterized protein n=1 Tax=Pseudomonas aphyarum TaxID=2942629 RepID=A0ABT5PWJ6_9PSED|nr:hypothetical protein [Pseudomonas aphyarum]MDD0971969.1 hypothetical protein [Pseudomonas aphyarum]MDD1128149.1 hypothetical protein [Pseudomonas aphyarum]
MAKPPKPMTPASSSTQRTTTDTPRVNVDNVDNVSNIHPGLHLQARVPDASGPSSQRTAQPDGSPRQPSVEVSDMLPRQPLHASVTEPETSARPASPVFIAAHLATRLTPATDSAQGIRRDGRERIYVDMREGTAMVHQHPDGRFQLTSASELIPSGFLVERIRDTYLWQKRPAIATRRPHVDESDAEAGSGKRSRLDNEDHPADSSPTTEQSSPLPHQPLNLSLDLWRNWGEPTKPAGGQSIEIDGLHYPIVSQIVRSNTPVVCIKNPRFSPERFEAFEQMLNDDLTLQPRWAARGPDNHWTVVEHHLPFEKPLTQYVTDTFECLSEASARAVAKTMFFQSRGAEVINGEGLQALGQTLRHWRDRSIPAPRHLADPLLLLPVQPVISDGTFGGRIVLPVTSEPHLQRLDFDPQKTGQAWQDYTSAPGSAGLQRLFHSVLLKSGYTVNPPDPTLLENALVFNREGHDTLFILKLPPLSSGFISRYTKPGSELISSASLMKLDDAGKQRLNTMLAQNKINYLVGGIQQPTPDRPTLFILREG